MLSAAIDCLVTPRFRPDYEIVLTLVVGSNVEAAEMSSSESIDDAFLSLADGVINRLSFACSRNVSVPICLGVTS